MKTITTFTATLVLTLPASVFAQDRSEDTFAGHDIFFTVSGGVISAPSFLGSSETSVYAIPNISVAIGDRLNISLLEGIEYDVYKEGNLTAGAILTYDFGREDTPSDHSLLLSDVASSEITGLGGIEETAEFGGYIEYTYGNLQTSVEVRKGVDGGHSGLVGDVDVTYNAPVEILGRQSVISFGSTASFSDDSYASTFFDVSAAQSAASGISEYDANGGIISYGLHASAYVPLNEHIALVGFAKYDHLAGDVRDSSIVQERGSEQQTTAGLVLNYTF
ncbi:Outer membrane scaffolding protein for murein synthesis, MipA/OmpV family [Octadecabacter temperatus]|uniref:MltA-interacting protein MipA n=1 Tax=Octadecabacter temperatus TaxID=1458307 RepID=A0A0K0Y1V4_9RHOB|nr:MipA/OmpV family protein [Octadecabacter temperatus]AKS44915.1 MltA-interacting protein MipA [Octadecabacter temperatus]SIO33704.1 Outer membrane scaffolding protein for murein synthesis, MipA/OmpV family [Octadecabacter temperatus]